MSGDGIFSKGQYFGCEERRGILKVFEGYSPDNGFQGGRGIAGYFEVAAASRKLLLQTGTLVGVGRTHQQVGHLSKIF